MLLFFLTADLHSEGILGVRDDEMRISVSKKAFLSLSPSSPKLGQREREGDASKVPPFQGKQFNQS